MDRNELHERVMLLKEELKAGRVKFAEGLDVTSSLGKVRFESDGKVDPDTVDSVVRALAMVIDFSVFRREVKKVPLKESQTEYFAILEKFFGVPFSEMKKHALNPHEIASHLASKPRTVEAFAADSEGFFGAIKDFWDFHGPIVEIHLQDMRNLKSIFGGDIFPSYRKNVATSVGLYIDTLVLPDPLMRLADFVGRMNPERLLYYASKHALNALQYKELALADVEPPIVVVAPDASLREVSYRPVLQLAGENDLLNHMAKLFGRSFSNQPELAAFLSKFSSSQQLAAEISDPGRLLFDTEWSGPIESQIERYRAEFMSELGDQIKDGTVGKIVELAILGRMMQANDLLFKASRYSGHPLIDAPTSWQYLLWKYEAGNRSDPVSRSEFREVLIAKAISVEGSARIGLIADVPPETLIELRRVGAMSELRSLLRNGIKDIDQATDAMLSEVGEVVVTNLNEAFEKHRKELRELSSKKKLFGFDIGKWITAGGLAIGAAATGNTGLAVLSAFAGMAGAPSIKELRNQWKEVQVSGRQIARSPSGILFRHIEEE